MGCAFKCDRCGRYYKNSTSSKGPVIKKYKGGEILDLCEECKVSLIDWLDKYVKDEWKKEDELYG